MTTMHAASAFPALAAALLFGASTPVAKVLVGDMAPLLVAGLLYLGSGIGLAVVLAGGGPDAASPRPRRRHSAARLPWLVGAIALRRGARPGAADVGAGAHGGGSASLLLNVEGVLTALIAWVVFKENADLRIVLGMVAIVAGGALLSWEPAGATLSSGACSSSAPAWRGPSTTT